MRKSLVHLVCRGLFAVLLGLTLVGCQTDDEQAVTGPPPPTTVSHDVAELVKRFPTLGKPVSAAWVQWNDDNSAPAGLKVEWLDAVVHLQPGASEALVAVTRPTDTGQKPSVQEVLRPEVPDGPFLTGDALDQAFSSADSSSYAYLDRGRQILVLQSTGVSGW
jgi:hypothetical protein